MIALRLAIILEARYQVWRGARRVKSDRYRRGYGQSNGDHLLRSLIAGEYDR